MSDVVIVAALSTTVAAISYALRRDAAINIADEAYLWYGVLRTAEGRVPVRDFRSYEPGRYWWTAGWLRLLRRDDIVAVRLAAHILFAASLALFGVAMRAAGHPWHAVVLALILIAAWSHPQFKLFEHAMILWAIAAAVYLLLEPGPLSLGVAGIMVGVTTVFGVNYAGYAGLAATSIAVALIVADRLSPASIGWLFFGWVVGAGPLLVCAAAVPGFARSWYQRRVRALLDRGTTNLPLPIPRPWRPAPRAFRAVPRPGRLLIRLWPVVLVAWPAAVFARFGASDTAASDEAVLLAAAVVGLFTMHHAFSRFDLSHVTQTAAPLLVGAIALAGNSPLTVFSMALVLVLVTGALVATVHPRWLQRRHPTGFVPVQIGPATLQETRKTADLVNTVRDLLDQHRPGMGLLAVPTPLVLYPALGREAPVYNTFCVYPATASEQEQMVSEIEAAAVGVAVVQDTPLDGREDLRFSRTHPHVWAYLQEQFVPIQVPGLASAYQVFMRPDG